MKKRVLLLILAIAMVISSVPFTAYGAVNDSEDYELTVPHENLGELNLRQYVYACDTCNKRYVEYVPSDFHDYNSGRIAESPECGVDVRLCKCQGCDKVYYIALSHIGHDPVDLKGEEPSCIVGYTDGKVCRDCDAIIVFGEVILATGKHAFEWVIDTPASCKKSGIKHEECKNKGCEEVRSEKTTIAKLSHTLVTIKGKAPTYSSSGLTDGKKCSACGAVTVQQKVIPKLERKSIKKAKFSVKAATYTGKAITQKITVKLGSKTLKNKVDYTVSYKNNKKVGKATVTIKGIGAYKDSVSKTFKINPKPTKVSKLTAAKKSLKVKIKKQTTQTTGYEVQYSTSKKFTKSTTKKITIKKAKTTSVTIKKLKAKKTYYVRVRTYKTVNGKKYYSGWSAYKLKKTK